MVRKGKHIEPPSGSTPASSSRWPDAPVYVRPTERGDLFEAEIAEWESSEAKLETAFYESFTRPKPALPRFRKSTRGRRSIPSQKIVDAGDGDDTFRYGDTVLVKTPAKLPSIGVIVALWEIRAEGELAPDASNMRVRIHWFLRPTELAHNRAKRDHTKDEIYFSVKSSAVFRPDEIISHCMVYGKSPQKTDVNASSRSPSKSKAHGRRMRSDDGSNVLEVFCCFHAIDSQQDYYYDLDWEEHFLYATEERYRQEEGGWGSGAAWWVNLASDDSDPPESEPEPEQNEPCTPSKKRGRKPRDETFDPELDVGDFEMEIFDGESLFGESKEPRTPSKKRKQGPTTPKKSRPTTPKRGAGQRSRVIAVATPHSKAAQRARLKAKAGARLAPGTPSKNRSPSKSSARVRPPRPEFASQLSLASLPKDPWLRAMHVLHVAARPDALPCREEEYSRVLTSVEQLLEEGSGGCVYISGVPGTGKTATVHAIVRELKQMAELGETNPFTYVEINGLKIPDASAAYGLLWEAVSGHDVASEGHLKISAKESLKALTRHFSGGVRAGPGGHACVVLMDELDQLVTAKQDVVYNFFNWPTLAGSKLVVLAVANTMDLPERVMTGRVRSRLGMIRINFQPYTTSQLEKIVKARLENAREGLEEVTDAITADGIKFAAMKVSSISGDARRVLDICRRAVELVQPRKRAARTDDVKEVIKVMQNSPTAAYLRECSFHERVTLAALVKCIKREGVVEIKWGEVQHQHAIYVDALADIDDPVRKPTPAELSSVLGSLVASCAMLVEEGVVASRKPEGERKVLLNLEQIEVERVLGEVGGSQWKNVLSV